MSEPVEVKTNPDLNTLFESEEFWLPIMALDGKTPFIGADGEPWRIKLAGPTHDLGFKAEEDMRGRIIRAAAGEDPTETYIDRALAPLVTRTLGWTPVTLGGGTFHYSPENAKLLYRKGDYIRRQVERALQTNEGFRKKPSAS